MKRRLFVLAVSVAVAAIFLGGSGVSFSDLWGENGELFEPGGRLPDFSYAGYHRGEKPLPVLGRGSSSVSVRDFGAKGDGETDDSDAFLKAVAAARRVVEVPPGRYRITRIIELTRSGVILKGAGADQTTLYFPKPLQDIRPNWGATTSGQKTSNYSWSGGFVTVRGDLGGEPLTKIVGVARRGARRLRVASTARLRPNQQVEIYQSDNKRDTLADHLYSGDAADTSKLLGRTHASIVVKIVALGDKFIIFDRPLRFDIRQEWNPSVRSFEPAASEVGIEGLTFEFPAPPYKGHFTEMGNNAIALTRVANCWVRNIRIVNPDSGVFITGIFNTVTDVVMESSRQKDKARRSSGHHGLYIGTDDNLFTRFDFRMKFIHDLSVSHCAGNVISEGKGVDLTFDHHKRVPYENLYTDIDTGEGSEVWRCGGGRALGKNCGARGTFWNIRARRPIPYPPERFGPPSMNLVAVGSSGPGETNPNGRWFEVLRSEVSPRNLHKAQLKRRLK